MPLPKKGSELKLLPAVPEMVPELLTLAAMADMPAASPRLLAVVPVMVPEFVTLAVLADDAVTSGAPALDGDGGGSLVGAGDSARVRHVGDAGLDANAASEGEAAAGRRRWCRRWCRCWNSSQWRYHWQ